MRRRFVRRRVGRQAGRGGIRLGFVVVVVVVLCFAELGVVVEVDVERVVVAQRQRGEGFAAVFARLCLRPAGDAEGGLGEGVAVGVAHECGDAAATRDDGNGVAAIRFAGEGKGGRRGGFPIQPDERRVSAVCGDGVGKEGFTVRASDGKSEEEGEGGGVSLHGGSGCGLLWFVVVLPEIIAGRGRMVRGFSLGTICNLSPPPPQGEARSGRVPMQNASAFCMGPGGGLGRGWTMPLTR